MGGLRGLIESVLPGFVFIVVFVTMGERLGWALIAAVAAALVAVAMRLAQRTPVTQAAGGLLGVAIGVLWAWRSGQAQDFFAWGLWTNAIYLVAVLVSIAVRWPAVGLVVEMIRSGFTAESFRDQAKQPAQTPADSNEPAESVHPVRERGDVNGLAVEDFDTSDTAEATEIADTAAEPNPFAHMFAWRRNPALVQRYTVATWLWVGMFALRLAVQVPLFIDGTIGWLGTARLVMGVPLWGLVLWLTWATIRDAHSGEHAGAQGNARNDAQGD
jgi:hypothetical protein